MQIFIDFILFTPGHPVLFWTQYTEGGLVRWEEASNRSSLLRSVNYSIVQYSTVQYSTVHLLRTENPQLFEVKLFSSKRQPRGAGGCR